MPYYGSTHWDISAKYDTAVRTGYANLISSVRETDE